MQIGTPEGKKGGIGEDKIYDKIIAENLSKFGEWHKLKIQEN